MVYDANFTGAYSGRNQFQLRLYVRRNSTSGNSSNYAWELLAEKIAYSTAWASDPTAWNVSIAGNNWSGTGSMDFRSVNTRSFGSGVTGWVAHDGNGYLNFSASANHAGGGLIGSASCGGTFSADRIPQVPGAPYSVAITQVTATSMVYQFSSTTDGGSAILEWQVQYATNSGFSTGVVSIGGGNGIVTLSGLTPGTAYWVRARGRNAVGWGPYGNAFSATTLSGAFVGNSSNPSFSAAAVYVGKDNSFVLSSVYVGKDGSFVVAS